MASGDLLQAIAVTAELTGTALSEGAAKVLSMDLSVYPEDQVLGALRRCRRELKGRLTIADVVGRLEDGRPGPEEAWAMLPRGEGASVVWTEEMAQAYYAAAPLMNEGDMIAGRVAFKEAYIAACTKSRDESKRVQWQANLGHDPQLRASVIGEAVRLGRLSIEQANVMLPAPFSDLDVPLLAGPVYTQEKLQQLLPAPRDTKNRSKELGGIMQLLRGKQ